MRIMKLIAFLFIIGCTSQKNLVSTNDIEHLKDVVFNKTIEFNAHQANPLVTPFSMDNGNLFISGSNSYYINLTNIPNYLKIESDRIKMSLPFYGQHQLANNYNGQKNNLVLDETIQEKSITYNEKRNSYTIKMRVKGEEESLEIKYTLHPNKNASLTIDSTHRNTISYNGNWVSK